MDSTTENTQAFVASPWNSRFPPSTIKAKRLAGSKSRLRPDYLAIRPLPGSGTESAYEFAVAESKGTQHSLENRSNCPADWSNQARNVSLTVDEVPITIPRHLVVATRVNPNGRRQKTRRLQVRAWNKADQSDEIFPPDAMPDVIAVHLFGLFMNIGLYDTARAMALSVSTRQAIRLNVGESDYLRRRDEVINASDAELRGKAAITPSSGTNAGALVRLDTVRGQVEVALAPSTMRLVETLREARTAGGCQPIIRATNRELDSWLIDRRAHQDPIRSVVLPFGAELTFPENWARTQ